MNADDDERDEKWQVELRERKRLAAQERYRDVCPPDYLETDWNDSRLAPYRAQIDQVRGWEYGPRGLVVAGPTGRGKTRSIFDLYRRLACEEARDVRYYFAGDWFGALQQQVNFGRDDARGWVEAVADRPLVIIDDLGQEALLTSKAEWAAGWFLRFIDLRLGRKLPLIVSTNLSALEMSRSMQGREGVGGEPFMRRLQEICDVVKF